MLRHRLATILAVAGCIAAASAPASASGPAPSSGFVPSAVASASAPATTTAATASVPVTRAAAGNRKAYATMGNPAPRWNPCAVIGYRFNPTRAPKGALTDVKGAVRRISSATGLRFVYRGTTSAVPRAKRGYNADYPSDTQLVIAWVYPGKQSEWLAQNKLAGMGGPAWSTGYTAKGKETGMIHWAGVVLNANIKLSGGFGAGPRYGWQGTRGQLLMHEIGHAIGLGHPGINDTKQIMYGTMTHKKAVWGAGDLTGLKLVGRSQGCLQADPPGATAAALTLPGTILDTGGFALP
ncbi:hypothetical protein AB0368_19770 [Actinoplanes sp. NPDC051475]|uniref:hypothetical protein n=1 Tax=Actinoplanes sp. NPDC051475 TaxID=3157225 RepID=UPI00344BA916